VVDGQVARTMGVALVARTPVPTLATPGAEHAGAEPLPGPRAVQGVVTTAIERPCVDRAATTRLAGQNAASRTELHGSRRVRAVTDLTLVTLERTLVDIEMSVIGEGGGVYSPAVLGLGARFARRAVDPCSSSPLA
jgi:hypothetical protein